MSLLLLGHRRIEQCLGSAGHLVGKRGRRLVERSLQIILGAVAGVVTGVVGWLVWSAISLFIGTNRQDIAFGRLTEREFKKFCDRFVADTREARVEFKKIYSCPYHPKGRTRFRKESVFRKPAPGIYKMAQQEFDLNLARCWMIGHCSTDILAGSRAGMGTILVETGEAGRDGAFHVEPHRFARDVRDAMAQIHEFEFALRC